MLATSLQQARELNCQASYLMSVMLFGSLANFWPHRVYISQPEIGQHIFKDIIVLVEG